MPFDLEAYAETLRDGYQASILTSATLLVGRKATLLSTELNTEIDRVRHIPTPFDYRAQVCGGLVCFGPTYRFGQDAREQDRYFEFQASAIGRLADVVGGRTLVLCASRKDLIEIGSRLRAKNDARIDPDGRRVLPVHGLGDDWRRSLARFRANPGSILLGLDRFWSGLDVPGPDLSCVVIPRLPNPSLGDPIVQHRAAHTEEGEFWSAFYRPAALLKLRQGFGRLIRSMDDTGVFAILDRRAAISSRMRLPEDALPLDLELVTSEEEFGRFLTRAEALV